MLGRDATGLAGREFIPFTLTVTTDARGAFVLPAIPPDRYRLWARADSRAGRLDGVLTIADGQLSVENEPLTPIDFSLVKEVIVEGRVLDSSSGRASGVRVVAWTYAADKRAITSGRSTDAGENCAFRVEGGS